MHTLQVGHHSHSHSTRHHGDVKDKPDAKKTEGDDGVAAKKKDAEAQIIKLKEAKGKDKVDWSDELGKKEKADNIPNLALAFG